MVDAVVQVPLLWTAAVLACTVALWLHGDGTAFRLDTLMGFTFVLGAPLPLVVPLIYLPLLKKLEHRLGRSSLRWWLLPLVGAVLALPMVGWIIELGSDDLQGALTGDPGSRARLIRFLDWPTMWPYYLLYGVFGAFLGLWQSMRAKPAPSARRRKRA